MRGIEAEKIKAGVERIFARKGDDVVAKNLAALQAGIDNSIK